MQYILRHAVSKNKQNKSFAKIWAILERKSHVTF